MNKTLLTLILILISRITFSQIAKLGEFSDSEISLTEVAFEPDASAVILVSYGNSKFLPGLLETTYFIRMKVLSEAGKANADIRIRYYAGDQRMEDISGVKAQTTNFANGNAETVKVSKDGIFEVDLDGGYKELRISFPNVQVGSIIEYQYKKVDKNLTFIDGWTFQNTLPTLYSQYGIKMNPNLEYRTMGQGQNFASSVEKTHEFDNYTWTLKDLHSLKEEPFMKNYRDYVDRIEFQLAQYRTSGDMGIQWKDVLNTWEVLGDEVISHYTQKGFYRNNPITKEFLDVDLKGATQLETAQKAYYYLRNNFRVEGDDWIYPQQNLNQLLKSKVGTPGELMLALMGVLKSEGIPCEPVLIGSKGYGRSDLVPFPFLNQFDEILLLAVLDGKPQYLDLSQPDAPFGYVDLDKHVKGGLYLQEDQSKLIPIDIQHNSNSQYFGRVEMNEEGQLIMTNSHRNYRYRGLSLAQEISGIEKRKESLEELFDKEDGVVFENFEVNNLLEEKDFLVMSFDTKFTDFGANEMILFNPLKFSSFSENPFTQEYRMFPVDFGYAFTETYNTVVNIPEGYELDDYPLEAGYTINGEYVLFIYSPFVVNNGLTISAKFVVNNPLIPASEYENLKYFMESVASKLSEPVILKKKSSPSPN
ncbi:DUF3857 domain-containing protein [Algoriphagus winogradskyi]|uniref:DUF3857 domain-containing protein n=1 Tax=Algoriphagus winogradskyi TaxID=237017 RepID=A0ABY1NKC2_9BACT|nr:DUF3857 domain-containing protein [Algoriphagus winogradskyi]SMP11959.1 protein of unknown function [Algoriphagus winogradskyi]